MKIYTRTGDAGTTGLFGGGRVPKHHPRIEAYGTVDEANSVIGMARAAMSGLADTAVLDEMLLTIQETMFILGADLATPREARADIDRIEQADIDWMEQSIDRLEEDLRPLRHFILPGGSTSGACLHMARTVCRRAERLVAHLAEDDVVNQRSMIYLNRLSDFLFVAARWVNARVGEPEMEWRGRK